MTTLLASGYDTFSMRNPDASLSVFELDLPRVLADKRAMAERAGLTMNATCVPCDLSQPSWRNGLWESGFRPGEKTFVSLLGISYYLEREAFGALAAALGGLLSEGSAICLDYPCPDDGPRAQTNRALARAANEPMRASYGRREMEALLAERGFLVYEHLDHREMTDQYFSEYNRRCPNERMEAPKGVCYALAVRKA